MTAGPTTLAAAHAVLPAAPPPLPVAPLLPWRVVLALALAAYIACGLLALQVAIPASFAAPLYPPAGIALVAALLYGWRGAAVGGLGAFIVNVTLSSPRESTGLATLLVPLLIALGAGLQAAAGAALVRRVLRPPMLLAEPRDVALFFALGGALACVVSTSISHAVLVAVGAVPMAALPASWVTWWAGDTLGVLIAAPIVLTLLGEPRSEWAPRRLTVGLPLAVVTALLALGILQVVRYDENQVAGRFERDAVAGAVVVAAEFSEPLRALEALRGVFLASNEVTRDEMRRATRAWLEPGRIVATGWSEAVRRADLPVWEARVRAEGLADFRVFDRGDLPAAPGDAVVAIRYIEPLAPNRRALGVNARSIPQARAALDEAVASGKPAATEAMRLTQWGSDAPADGVVVYQPVYADADGGPSSPLRGVVFVTLRPEDVLARLRGTVPGYLNLCLIDAGTSGGPRRLAGVAGCELRDAALWHVQALPFGGRQWELHLTASPSAVPDAGGGSAWMFSVVGLLAVAMLGALLLTVTGRTRRIEAAVRERTAALEAEVAERERAQAALRESERRFRNILNTVPIGIVYSDIDGRVRQTNPRFRELSGYSERELQAMPSGAWTHPDDAVADAMSTSDLVEGRLPMVRREMRIVTKDGRTQWVQTTTRVLRDSRGRPRRIVSVVEDISEHLRLQEAESARELAEGANRAKSDFLSRMSHELRTPLNAMLGFAQLLELDHRNPLAPTQKPWVAQIQQAGWHLLDMINDVLDLSRIESGNLRLQAEQIDSAKVIAETVSLVEADAERRGIRITTSVEAGAEILLGDPTRVKQILTNLLSNAVKYNVDGGRIQVLAQARGTEVAEVAVVDTGLGMTAEQVADLFKPFNRLGRERTAAPGTGIGLVISKRLAELMGGTLSARSEPGEGTVFTLQLPLVADPDTVASDLPAFSLTDAAYHQRVVHYVEDNETNVEVMRGVLAQRPQVRLEVSLTGLDGLARIRVSPPDLVLLDMHLPDIQGLELLRHLKDDPATAQIPVVVVSANALADQIEEAMAAGAVRYLTKPVGVGELLEVLDEALDGAETRYG